MHVDCCTVNFILLMRKSSTISRKCSNFIEIIEIIEFIEFIEINNSGQQHLLLARTILFINSWPAKLPGELLDYSLLLKKLLPSQPGLPGFPGYLHFLQMNFSAVEIVKRTPAR